MRITSTAIARFRMDLAVQHMLAVARFARRVAEIESENSCQPLGNFFDEIISYTMATILSSVAAIEAHINETFVDADTHFPEVEKTLRNEIWNVVEQKEILEKYQWAMVLKGKPRLDRSSSAFQHAVSLIKLRNAIVHFKPEWYDEQKVHKKIEDRLKGKFRLSPFISSGPFFPQKCMSHGCAAWSVNAALAFEDAFSKESGLPANFDQFKSQFSTTPLTVAPVPIKSPEPGGAWPRAAQRSPDSSIPIQGVNARAGLLDGFPVRSTYRTASRFR
jgi:hypothetical protein